MVICLSLDVFGIAAVEGTKGAFLSPWDVESAFGAQIKSRDRLREDGGESPNSPVADVKAASHLSCVGALQRRPRYVIFRRTFGTQDIFGFGPWG